MGRHFPTGWVRNPLHCLYKEVQNRLLFCRVLSACQSGANLSHSLFLPPTLRRGGGAYSLSSDSAFLQSVARTALTPSTAVETMSCRCCKATLVQNTPNLFRQDLHEGCKSQDAMGCPSRSWRVGGFAPEGSISGVVMQLFVLKDVLSIHTCREREKAGQVVWIKGRS